MLVKEALVMVALAFPVSTLPKMSNNRLRIDGVKKELKAARCNRF